MFQEIRHVFKVFTLLLFESVFMLLLFKLTLMNDEINGFINVSRALIKIIGSRVLVPSDRRGVKHKIIDM
jgi:hypothetical protein